MPELISLRQQIALQYNFNVTVLLVCCVCLFVVKLLSKFYIHFTVHRNRFLFSNQPDALIIQILFCHKTPHVSGIFSAHSEFSTVHSAQVSFMQILMTASKQSQEMVRLFYGNVMRFEVLTLLVHIEVFCDNALRRLINIYRRFEESCCFGLWGEAVHNSFLFK